MVIVLLLLCTVSTTRASFIRTPTSVRTTLGSSATFTCSASRGSITWIVNGSTLPELNTPDINNMNAGIMSTLIIPAKAKYNNTNVTCSINIRAEGLFLDSDVVVLRVQGTPAALSNLTSKNLALEKVIRLTWDAPPTLDIAAVDPDISYCVDIRVNINDKDSFPLTTVCNVYIPQFNFTMDYPNTSTSVIYEFRVTPRNGAGEGPKSAPVYGFFSGPPAGIIADMVEVSVSINLLDVDLIVSYVGGIPPGEMPNQLQVHAFTIDDDQNNAHCSVTIPFTLNSNGMVFIHLNKSTCGSGLVHHRRYKAIVIVKNDLGTTNSTGEIHFSTHEIQTVRANSSSRPGVVNIICTFAENSGAVGYLSILHPKASSSQEMFVVANRHDAVSAVLNISVPGVLPGDYVVIVFDLQSNGLPVLSTVTNPYVRSAGESDVAVLEPGEDEDGFHVDGTLIEVPDPAMTMEQQLCIFFESSTSSDQIVVLAHHSEDPTKLSAYSSHGNQCFEAPTAGNYSFAVFIQNGDSTLEPPATSPEILIRTVSTSSDIPAPSITTPTIMTDPETLPLGAIIGIIVAVLAIAGVCVVIAVMYIIVKKRMSGGTHGFTDNQRENQGHSTSLELNSNNRTEKGEVDPQRITADSEMEQTDGLVCAVVNTLPGKTKPPARDDRVQHSNILTQPVVIASTLIILAAVFSAELNMKERKSTDKTQDFGGSGEELNLNSEQLVEKREYEPGRIAEVLHFSRELNPEREELVLKVIGLLVIKCLLPFSTGRASSP